MGAGYAGTAGDPVVASSGSVVHQQQDMFVNGVGLALESGAHLQQPRQLLSQRLRLRLEQQPRYFPVHQSKWRGGLASF